ncbi:hypothetical protein TNCV_934641 [Trichonephila clavipes]|nr:hypothetical protein TNCV_934641 [Trichonephila clavipes]
MYHLLIHDAQPIDLTQLTMNFNRRNALCIQELYYRPNFASGGRRNKNFHFGSLLPHYWHEVRPVRLSYDWTATAGSDVVQSGRPIFDDFFQHLWPYIGNNTANVVFQMVKRLWLIRIDQ